MFKYNTNGESVEDYKCGHRYNCIEVNVNSYAQHVGEIHLVE